MSLQVLKGHDDHVITCLQFSGDLIVSGSDDNTLKVWSAITGKVGRNSRDGRIDYGNDCFLLLRPHDHMRVCDCLCRLANKVCTFILEHCEISRSDAFIMKFTH